MHFKTKIIQFYEAFASSLSKDAPRNELYLVTSVGIYKGNVPKVYPDTQDINPDAPVSDLSPAELFIRVQEETNFNLEDTSGEIGYIHLENVELIVDSNTRFFIPFTTIFVDQIVSVFVGSLD